VSVPLAAAPPELAGADDAGAEAGAAELGAAADEPVSVGLEAAVGVFELLHPATAITAARLAAVR
jgi:hypothetical protein